MTLDSVPDVRDLPTADLLAVARQALTALAERWSGPNAVDTFEPVVPPRPQLGWSGLASYAPIAPGESAHGPDVVAPPELWASGSLPVVQRSVEELSRVLTAVHTTLAGHAAHAMENGLLREPLLGIPGGARPFRDAPDWMVKNLRIPRPEALKRINRARLVQPPAPEPTGHQRSAAYPVLATSFLTGQIDGSSLDRIADALNQTKKDAEVTGADAAVAEQWLAHGEQMLTAQATLLDPDSMRHACTRWRQWAQHALNPDGSEPSEALPSVQQGLSYHGQTRGFHIWKIAADDLQHEVLNTIAGAATNPRAKRGSEDGSKSRSTEGSADGSKDRPSDGSEAARAGSWPNADAMATDPRSRNQRQLDGLTSALMGALAMVDGNGLPASGGIRPLVMVTIDFETLAGQVSTTGAAPPGAPPDQSPAAPPGDSAQDSAGILPPGLGNYRSEAAFTGPLSPNTIRTLACDGDILPVVLGGSGQVLDVGRAQRLFPARLRKAITARDGGCAAPGCTMPAPWSEVHHIDHWEHGGPTSVDNGVLLCSRHHHAVHSGSWAITVEDGIPWFVPAPYLDPFRTPQRNRYWRS